MPKIVPPSKFQEWKGLDRIAPIVHEMKCIFRPLSQDDFGIDGEIEVVIPLEDGRSSATGGIIRVQSKSGQKYVTHDTPSSFVTPVEKTDLELWYNANNPVIFIVYHQADDKLYWKEIKTYVRTTPNVFQSPFHITFDKTVDEFSAQCFDQIRQLADVSQPRVSLQQKERLYSNLLLVKRMPALLTQAATSYKSYEEVRSRIQGPVPPFCIIEGKLYTLADLRDERCVLRDFCDLQKINDVPAEQWAKDEARRRDYIFLLNQLLGIHRRECGLRYNPDFERNYFPRQDQTRSEFKRSWVNIRTGRTAPSRIIAKYYVYGIKRFWRHLAVKLSFRPIGNSWFLQVVPKYLFTDDGEIPSDRDLVGPYSTRLKAKERNIAVLNHVLFWADILSQQNPAIELKLDGRIVMVIEKEPLSGIANFAIPNDSAIYDDTEDDSQPSLFALLEGISGESENDEY